MIEIRIHGRGGQRLHHAGHRGPQGRTTRPGLRSVWCGEARRPDGRLRPGGNDAVAIAVGLAKPLVQRPDLYGFVAGLGGRDITREVIAGLIDQVRDARPEAEIHWVGVRK